MDYQGKSHFINLNKLSEEVINFAEWTDFFTYCALLERGLRKEALAKLNVFLSFMKPRPFEQRRRFVSWLYQYNWNIYATYPHTRPCNWTAYVPYLIKTQLAEPTLLEWVELDPHAVEPLLYLGKETDLHAALELDAHNAVACIKLSAVILERIEYVTHELPRGYLGDDPFADLADLQMLETLLDYTYDQGLQLRLSNSLTKLKKKLNDYIQGLP